MRKFHYLILFFLSWNFSFAQLNENFSDGDFTSNPTWTGDATLFKVNTSFQLQLNGTGDATAALSVPLITTAEMEWSCWVKLSFAASDNNFTRIYISSDQQDLKSPLNGYYIKLGETGSNDAIELVRQSGSTHTVVCRGSEGFVASAFAIKIKVVRTTGGSWKVYADPAGGNNYQVQASGTDNTFITGSYSGVYCKYTSSNSTKFYFDDFYAGPIIVDNTPPAVVSVSMTDSKQLTVIFNEAVSAATATNVNNYLANPGSIIPASATMDQANPAEVRLVFNQSFNPDQNYTLTIENVKDISGNTMTTAQFPFSWHQAKIFDILINEIMADPSPPVNLPDAEYVELFNRSAFPVNLKGWIFTLGSSNKVLPQFVLAPGEYVILCDDGVKPLLDPYGKVISFTSFAVTNASGTIILQNQENHMIHSVNYTDDWYKTGYKEDGGWSLEMIDPLNPCGEAANWTACNNNDGGTPGKVNSVKSNNPDLNPPSISRVGVTDATHITVWFTESCDSIQLLDRANYIIDNGMGNPTLVTTHAPDYKLANLTLNTPLVAGVLYTLTSTGSIVDCAGNKLLTGALARFAIPSEAAANDIVINELLYDAPEGCVDFVEIYNRSSSVFDLKDLVLSNYDTVNHVLIDFNEISKVPFLILPGDFMVLSTDSAAIMDHYTTTNPAGFINMNTFPSMNNDEGVVAIATKGAEIIDVVAYTSDMQYPLLTEVDGVSLERISTERLSGDKTNWHSASEAVGYATPGYKNSQMSQQIDSDNEIALAPEIFSPDNDGYNDNLTINYRFTEPGYNATITIYDASGRKVRNLVVNELCGTSGTFSWDGINNERQKSPIGRYIVLVEIFNLQGSVKKYKKSTILGGKLN